jgi:hypothetical protein
MGEALPQQPCVYGTREALAPWNPPVANWQVYGKLLTNPRSLPRWQDRLRL